MRYRGTWADGSSSLLGCPSEFRFSMEEDAPADLFRGTFPWIYEEKFLPLLSLDIYTEEGELFFRGRVDQENRTRDSSGIRLTVSARGPAAVLLDNEAVPQTYQYVSLGLLAKEHGAPYGFTRWKGDGQGFFSSLTVSKGMSEWEVLDSFCRRFLGTRLRIRETCLDASGGYGEKLVRFGTEVPCVSLSLKYRESQRYSEILLRPENTDGYSRSVLDPEAMKLGTRRRRLLSGTEQKARELLEKSKKQAFTLQAVCPGAPRAGLWDRAETADESFGGQKDLYVAGICYEGSGRGEYSRYTLRKMEEPTCGLQNG